MRAKYVNEDGYTNTTDTGIEKFFPYLRQSRAFPDLSDKSELGEMVPPATEKFTKENFERYINDLISQVLSQSPILALKIFTSVLKDHPYLTKRGIGFKASNPYSESINKFLQAFKNIAHR